MNKQFAVVIAMGAISIFSSCANNPSGLPSQKTGSAEVWASLVKPQTQNVLAKTQKSQATTWDSLIVRITASDMDTLLVSTKFSPSDPYISTTVENIPAGKKRLFEVFTKTKDGTVIHTSVVQTLDVSQAEKKTLDFKLVPVRGSIYVDISNIPTNVKRICATFAQLVSCEDRTTKLFLSIDNVPDSTNDSLVLEGTDSAGAIVYRSAIWLKFSVLRDTSVTSSFYRVTTGVTVSATVQTPAVTVVSANVGSQRTIGLESGRLIISEIMYNANDSEYIEIYNPLSVTYNDSLIIEIDGNCRTFGMVSIQPKNFFVVGRKSLPWADTYNSVSSALDLSSAGNWLSLRSKAAGDTVIDWVAFTGGSNSQEWPNVGSAKKSIVLDSLLCDPQYNNYGRNWKAAQTLLNQLFPSISTSQYGSPKSADI
jgi:hypothetical protein